MHVRLPFGATAVLSAAVMLAAAPRGLSQVTVVKARAATNPTVHIAAVDCPPALQKRLREVVGRCDWFTVVPERGNARYTLDCRYSAGPPASLDVRLRADAEVLVSSSQPVKDADWSWPVYRAIDSVISGVFQNPGLCASKIAFAVGGQGCKEVFTCNFDGTGAENVTRNQTISTEPSWAANGKALVYTMYESNGVSVVLVDMMKQRQRRLSRFPGLNAGADLSPDGRRAVLCLSRDRRVELYLLDIRSGSKTKLTNDAAVESSPCWSPDGKLICYASDMTGRPLLYVMPAVGGRPKRLLADSAEAVSPDWSPASNQICFATRAGGNYALAVTDPDDQPGKKTIITNAAGDWESPSWAPDGRHVVCSRRLGGKRGLCMVDAWHGTILPVTKPADHSLPSWSSLF